MKQSTIYRFADNFEFIYLNKNFQISENYKTLIAEHWKKAISENDNFFNGTVICLDKIFRRGDKICLQFLKSSYAHFIAAETGLLPKELYPRTLYVSALIETNDGFVVFEKTGKLSFDTGRFQFIGGGLDENSIAESSLDYLSCMKNEIAEEIGICFNPDIHYLSPLFISFGENAGKISIVFHFKPNMNRSELNNQLNKHNANLIKNGQLPEVDSFIFTDKNRYAEFFAVVEKSKIGENLFSSLEAFFTGCMKEVKNITDLN